MADPKILYHDLDFNKNRMLNPILNPVNSSEQTLLEGILGISDEGYIIWNITTDVILVWDGTQFISSTTTEIDPVFTAWLAGPPNISEFTNDLGYLTSFTETDPIWTAASVNYRTFAQNNLLYYPLSSNPAGYLTSFTETDPVWLADKPSYRTKVQNDSLYYPLSSNPAGYLTTYTDTNLATTDLTQTSNSRTYTIGSKVLKFDGSISNMLNLDGSPTGGWSIGQFGVADYLHAGPGVINVITANLRLNGQDINASNGLITYDTVLGFPVSTFANDVGYITSAADTNIGNTDLTLLADRTLELDSKLFTILRGTKPVFQLDPSNKLYWFGDIADSEGSTKIRIDDANQYIGLEATLGLKFNGVDLNTLGGLATWAATVALPVSTFPNDVGYITGASETDPIWNADKPNYLTSAIAATTYVPQTRTLIGGSGNISISGSGDLSANRTISQSPASTSVDGYLSAANFTIFNNKQPQLNGTGFVKATGTTISYDNSTYLTTSSAASTYQPLDSDLTAIAGLTATTDNFIVSVASAWASRTPAQVRTTLALVIGTNVQAWDTDLDAIAALAASNDDFIQRKAGAWTNRTVAQVKTDLGLSGSNTGDQTISITGDVTAAGSTGVLTATVTKLNGTTLSGLATGILKNTTGTGVPSIAVAGTDYVAPNGAISGNTRMKITYDSKGLVTAGATAASTDLSDVVEWTDYSATSTITGFTAYATKNLQYKIVGKTLYVMWDIQSTASNGAGTTCTFTLPNNASAWGSNQYGTYHSLNNNTTQAISVWKIVANSNLMEFSTTGSITNTAAWIAGTTRGTQGQAFISIA